MAVGFYIHYRANGVPFYVGKGTSLRSRLFSRRNQFHKNIVQKDGRENIAIKFTLCASEEEAFRKEISLIALYHAIGIELVNATDGGERPSNPTPEVRAKISAGQKLHWEKNKAFMMGKLNNPTQRAKARENGLKRKGKKLTSEHLAKLSESHKGNNYNIGFKHTAETKAKLSAERKSRYENPEYRAKMQSIRIGKKHSPETKAKIKESLLRRHRDANNSEITR